MPHIYHYNFRSDVHNHCLSNTCNNGTNCIPTSDSFKCECPEGKHGYFCEKSNITGKKNEEHLARSSNYCEFRWLTVENKGCLGWDIDILLFPSFLSPELVAINEPSD